MQITSNSVSDTLKIGRRVAKNLQKGDILCLFGEFGSGKTVLVKGIAQGLGIKKDRVISPSFVLIRQYSRGRFPLYHFDLYRLKAPRDVFALGYEDYLYDNAVTVIEWADRLGNYLPPEYLKIEITIKDKNHRLLRLNGLGERYADILKVLLKGIA